VFDCYSQQTDTVDRITVTKFTDASSIVAHMSIK